jgi:hypothetical protein
MAWPGSDVDTTDVDSDTDSPSAARVDIKDSFDKLNQIRNHVSAYIQGLLDDADAAAARATLGLGALAVKSTIATADVDADAITYAKIQNVSATDKLLGRSTAGAGDVEEIACTAAGRAILDDADAAAQRATLGIGSPITNSLGADVLLNNTANYFDGPSVAQGTSGTWFVSGTISVFDSAVADSILAKLWDGTTVIASGLKALVVAGEKATITLSGFITSPAGNLRISARDQANTTGKILFNQTGNSKDSTITAIRIG